MRKKPKIIIVLCLFISIVSGCNNEVNASVILNKSMSVMNEVTNYQSSFKVNTKFDNISDVEEKERELLYHGNFEYNSKSELMHMTLNKEQELIDKKEYKHIEAYVQRMNEMENKYIKEDDSDWSKEDEFNLSIKMIAMLIPSWDEDTIESLQPKFIKNEEIEGRDTYKIKVILNKDIKVEERLSSIFDKMDKPNLELYINVDKDTNYISKYSLKVDNKNNAYFMEACNKIGMFGADKKVKSIMMEINLMNFNAVNLLQIPNEVIDIEGAMDSPSISAGNIDTQTHIWESLNFSIDHNSFNLEGLTFDAVMKLGFKANEFSLSLEEINSRKLKVAEQIFVNLDRGKETYSFVLRNNSDHILELNKSDVISISANNKAKSFMIEGNIKIADTQEVVLKTFGEANIISNDIVETWTYTNSDGAKRLTIGFKDGLVEMIGLHY